jgi:phosphopentomutase
LVYGKNIKENVNLGIRSTFADISATILDILDLPKLENGISFRKEIEK